MSYAVYKDSGLKRPASSGAPKWFLLPSAGGSKTATLYVGDPKSPMGTSASLVIRPVGSDVSGLVPRLQVSLSPHGGAFGIPNTAVILAPQSLASPVAFDVRVSCAAGVAQSFTDWTLEVTGVPNQLPVGYCGAVRADQGLASSLHVLDASRQLGPMPGFVWGKSRWRDASELNQQALVPTSWDISPASVGLEKFVSGIGAADDLELVSIEQGPKGAIQPRIRRGDYFTSVHRHYLPADPKGGGKGFNAEVFPASSTGFTLKALPQPQTPVFIGRWLMDAAGTYETDVSYRYLCAPHSALDPWDPNDSGPQFLLDRSSGRVTLNRPLPSTGSVFLGILLAGASAQFYVPLFPLLSINRVYAENPYIAAPSFDFDPATGLLTVGGSGWAGCAMFADYTAGLAAVYELPPADPDAETNGTRLITTLDLNPAVSGVAQGTLMLMRRRWTAASLSLYADKPRISVPASLANTPNIAAFGPVFYEEDYALLVAEAADLTGQSVPGLRLKVVPGDGFEGEINYQDPTADTVWVTTGAAGSASMIYTPPLTYGWYLALGASVSGNSITLPAPVAGTELYTALEGWSVLIYKVRNDDPYLGKVGANEQQGEVLWAATGTPGTESYRTNGKRVLVKDSAGKPVVPNSAPPGPNQQVTTLSFPSLAQDDTTGAYFVALAGRVTVQVETADGKLKSNPIVLQLAPPEEITDQDPDNNLDPPTLSGYLILDDPSGRVNVNRLAGGMIPGFSIERIP